jgi:hypothetical protein
MQGTLTMLKMTLDVTVSPPMNWAAGPAKMEASQ